MLYFGRLIENDCKSATMLSRRLQSTSVVENQSVTPLVAQSVPPVVIAEAPPDPPAALGRPRPVPPFL